MAKSSRDWRMKEKCENCPFHETGPGRHLRDSLQPGRFEGIVFGLMRGDHFFCHKTTTGEEDDDGKYIAEGKEKLCAGAIELQEQAGVTSQYAQVCERLELLRSRHKGKNMEGVNSEEIDAHPNPTQRIEPV